MKSGIPVGGLAQSAICSVSGPRCTAAGPSFDLFTEPVPNLISLILKGNMARDGKFDFCPGRSSTPNLESSPNSICPLAHTQQPPVSVATGFERLWIYSATVVTHQEAQLTRRVLDLNLNAFCLRVAECLGQRFSTNPVNFISKDWL